jgi:hypothetical protein
MKPKEIRDTTAKSRKGRKPKHGVAMTAAERKRRQRDRQRKEARDLPSWLRIRHRLWKLVQNEFCFSNADELSHALTALGLALTMTNMYRSKEMSSFSNWWFALEAYCSINGVASENQDVIDAMFHEFKPYKCDLPHDDIKDARLMHILRDIGKRHENQAEEAEVKEQGK